MLRGIVGFLLLGLLGCGGGCSLPARIPAHVPTETNESDDIHDNNLFFQAADNPAVQVSFVIDGFAGHEWEAADGINSGLGAVRSACEGYDPCKGQPTVLPPNMRVVQVTPSTTETIDGQPCFDPRPYGMPDSEYQKRFQERGYGCSWGYASIQDWAVYMTPHVLADGSLDPAHVRNLANHETKHLVGAWNHGQVLCPSGVGKIWLRFGHGGECDLTGGP